MERPKASGKDRAGAISLTRSVAKPASFPLDGLASTAALDGGLTGPALSKFSDLYV